MGCTSSKVDDGGPQARPFRTTPPPVDPSTVVWTADDSYGHYIKERLEKTVASGREGDLASFYSGENTGLRAVAWLKERFRHIDEIHENGVVPSTLGGQPVLTEMWFGAGPEGTGMATMFLVYTGKDADENPDKETINEAIMAEAQEYSIGLLNRAFTKIAQHMHVCVVVESNATICTPHPDLKPLILPIPHQVSREEQQWHKSISRQIKVYGAEAVGGFNKFYFDKIVGELCQLKPGVSVWDDGDLAFNVGGSPYQWGSRLLVTRDESNMKTRQGIKATHFEVKHPFGNDDKPPAFLFKMFDGSADPGGVDNITLLVATDPSILWPKVGQCAKSPAFKAAEVALMDKLDQMYKQGAIARCRVHLIMGQDQKTWAFVGHDSLKDQSAVAMASAGETVSNAQPFPVGNVHIASFGIDLEELPHDIMYNEKGEFHGFFGYLRQRYTDNPRTAEIHAITSVQVMKVFLENAFPGTEISDQGELVIPAEDGAEKSEAQTMEGSHLFVVRDPTQAPKDVIAVSYLMALPDGLKPTGHYEDSQFLKDGENALLKVMKQMYEKGEISDKECTASVRACFDGTIYQFVEGSKFVDYSETQMLRFALKL
ncbi:hypothetical protein VHEMI08393 [[Torrubiella] hemipterigena]|uniref:Uncharacterized protein n=1 Tax=[Torrubiella] hemipterigena TaxID=1531966 RepID=A0A0A1TPN2_9HYPO|nr:hypothetical protein VHEMI08393 [[Torrubiella] hemipterigena]